MPHGADGASNWVMVRTVEIEPTFCHQNRIFEASAPISSAPPAYRLRDQPSRFAPILHLAPSTLPRLSLTYLFNLRRSNASPLAFQRWCPRSDSNQHFREET